MSNLHISGQNPNHGIGGRGCLCHPGGSADCAGPYAIFPATETDSNLSPYAVLSLACAQEFVRKAKKAGKDILASGEDDPAPEPTL